MPDFIADFKAAIEASWATLPQKGTTTAAQAKRELEILLKDLVAVTAATKATSINMTGNEMEKMKPEIIAYCTSHLRVAYTLKNLSSPFSPLDGPGIQALLQQIHAKFLEVMGECARRLPQTEVEFPGFGKFFLYVIQTMIKPYHQHLAKAVPPTIPQIVIVEFGTAADSAVLIAVNGLV